MHVFKSPADADIISNFCLHIPVISNIIVPLAGENTGFIYLKSQYLFKWFGLLYFLLKMKTGTV